MKRKIHILVWVLSSLWIFSSCDKVEKKAPNSFTKQSVWTMTELSIGYDDISSLAVWEITSFEDGTAIWRHSNGTYVSFKWSFSTNASKLTFHLDYDDKTNKVNQAYSQCENLSGTYKVLTSKNGLYEIESYETTGYVGPRVFIRLE